MGSVTPQLRILVYGIPGSDRWIRDIENVARKGMLAVGRDGQPFDGPVRLVYWFLTQRPKEHFGTAGNIRSNAPAFPLMRPSVTNAVRTIENAMTGIVFKHVEQIVQQGSCRVYSKLQAVKIEVWGLPAKAFDAQADSQEDSQAETEAETPNAENGQEHGRDQ